MKQFLLLLACSCISASAYLQTISPVELKSTETGSGKLKKAPKKLYIAEFTVNYQLLHLAEDSKKGDKDASDGFVSGNLKVVLGLGLDGLSENDLKENTNYLYRQVVKRFRDEGYDILDGDAAAGIKEFAGWERKVGGGLSQAQFKGFITSTPDNFVYYAKGTREDGREKKTFTDNSAKISFQLKNATVVKVNLFLPMAENGESWASAAFLQDIATKVVLESNLMLDDDIAPAGGGTGYSATGISFINSEAMSLPTSMHVYGLKKQVDIGGVLEKKKYKYSGRQDYDNFGGLSPYYKVFEVNDIFMKKIIPIKIEAAKYNQGVRMACEAFLNAASDSFLKNAGGR